MGSDIAQGIIGNMTNKEGGKARRSGFRRLSFRTTDRRRSIIVNHEQTYRGSFRSDLQARLWIEETNDLVAIETEISLNLKGLVAIEIATAVRKNSLAAVATAIWFFETPPRRERELDR